MRTLHPDSVPLPGSDWLTLSQASRLLGVHPTTLRAWVNSGALRAFRTPGGHRRFELAELRLFLARRAQEPERALTVTPDRTLQDVRRELHGTSLAAENWYRQLSDRQRLRQREMGQRLLGLLLQFVSRRENGEHFLAEGKRLASEYGTELAAAGLSAVDLARAFLFFRRAVVQAAFHPEGQHAQGDREGLQLLRSIDRFMDELLIATLDAYDQARRSRPEPPASRALRESRMRRKRRRTEK